MTCPRCLELQRELREARDELIAWRANAADEEAAAAEAERFGRWREALGKVRVHGHSITLTPALDGLLGALIAAKGALVRRSRLIETRTVSDRELTDENKMLQVDIWRLRQLLAGACPGAVIEVVSGAGYRVPVESRARILAAIEGAERSQSDRASAWELKYVRSGMAPGTVAMVIGREVEWVARVRASLGRGAAA